jgi:hypothetical protein
VTEWTSTDVGEHVGCADGNHVQAGLSGEVLAGDGQVAGDALFIRGQPARCQDYK